MWVIIILGKTSYLGFKWVFWIRMRFHWEKKKGSQGLEHFEMSEAARLVPTTF